MSWTTKLVEYRSADWSDLVEEGWFTRRIENVNGMRVAVMGRL